VSVDRKDELHSIIQDGVEDRINAISEFFSAATEISIEPCQQSANSPDIWVILLRDSGHNKPQNIMVFFEYSEEQAKTAARQLALVFTAFGYEIIEDGKSLDFSEEEQERINEMGEFFSQSQVITSSFAANEDSWTIILSSDILQRQLEVMRLDKSSKMSVVFAEKCLGLFLASQDKSLTLADGTEINLYGCAVYGEFEADPDEGD